MPADPFDPRPRCAARDGVTLAEGLRCATCGYHTFDQALRCPLCAGPVKPAEFGPDGVVFASTRVYVGLPGREPPYSLAYVVFDNGPRALVHTTGDVPLPVGERIRLIGSSDAGDLVVESAAGG